MLAELRQKSQITIPKEIITKLGLNEGDKLEISENDGVITIMPVFDNIDALFAELEGTP